MDLNVVGTRFKALVVDRKVCVGGTKFIREHEEPQETDVSRALHDRK
jgi:hypothetical protein